VIEGVSKNEVDAVRRARTELLEDNEQQRVRSQHDGVGLL